MIPIQKNAEPIALAQLRQKCIDENCSPDAAYKRLRNPLKKDVRRSLIDEQGGLCAYCMCKIPRNDVDPNITPIIIEHINARNLSSGLDMGQGLDYNNFVATCHGNSAPHGTRKLINLTCDAHKENKEFKKINPCRSETLSTIFYEMTGAIDATDPDVKSDLIDTLNLNCSTSPLIAERKSALDSLIADIGTVTDDDILPYCESILKAFRQETNDKTPYVGILMWYLQTTIERISNN
ncbi:retron system putative HNH endonuclease [Amedibacillus sp. YH-ame10]